MSDDPHPSKVMKHFNIRNFIFNTLLLTATTAVAQEQQVAQNDSDNSDKLTLTIGAENIAALTLQQDKTTFYNCLAPSFSARAENKHGDYAKVSGVEGIIYNNDALATTTIKFMMELGKQLGKGTTLVFKAGREATEGAHVFDNQFNYYANATDVVTLGNGTERIVFGYQKGNNFVELGIIGNNGEGFYIIPNPKQSDFWAKCGLTLLEKSGVKLDMTGAVRAGRAQRRLFGAFGVHSKAYGGKIYGHYDLAEHRGNLGVRAWHDLKRGWKMITESVINKHKDLSVRSGVGKDGMQFSVEFSKPRKQPASVNFTVTSYLARSKTVCGKK